MTTVQAPTSTPQPGGGTGPTAVPISRHALDYLRRVRAGNTGSLPAVLGLIVLCVVFGIARPVFFSAGNFANLFTQGAQVTVIAMGLVFVLLLGEIDLSAGFASGVCGAVMCVLLTNHHVPWPLSVLAAVATGVVIGFILGFLVAKIGIPSFIVTLAAFLALQGVALTLLGGGTNISVYDKVIIAIDNNNIPVWLGWVLLAVMVVGYAAVQLVRRRRRAAQGLPADSLALIAVRVGTVLVLGGIAVQVLNRERSHNPLLNSLRGVPIIVPIILALLLLGTFVLGRTRFGRHIYAVGGNREAARRAGIGVGRIRIAAFVICSATASIGGIIAVSKANSVDSNTGGSSILLYAVGAAVIGGTSLFGGRGRVVDAVIGGAVIAVIDNGMGLMNYGSDVKYMVTGGVLLLAAGVDALSRRRSVAGGLG